MSQTLDTRRRRLLFRAWHRGTREMDLMMGRFCDSELAGLPESDIDDLEALMDAPDPSVFAWLSGEQPVPADHDCPVFHKIRAFHTHASPLFR